jgi:hypothetical protein
MRVTPEIGTRVVEAPAVKGRADREGPRWGEPGPDAAASQGDSSPKVRENAARVEARGLGAKARKDHGGPKAQLHSADPAAINGAGHTTRGPNRGRLVYRPTS